MPSPRSSQPVAHCRVATSRRRPIVVEQRPWSASRFEHSNRRVAASFHSRIPPVAEVTTTASATPVTIAAALWNCWARRAAADTCRARLIRSRQITAHSALPISTKPKSPTTLASVTTSARPATNRAPTGPTTRTTGRPSRAWTATTGAWRTATAAPARSRRATAGMNTARSAISDDTAARTSPRRAGRHRPRE